MNDKINIKKESDYHNGTISVDTIGNNNFKINSNENDNKGISINNNIKPMLNNSNGNNRIKIKPRRVPIESFGMLANQKSDLSDNEDDDSDSDESITSFENNNVNNNDIDFSNSNEEDDDTSIGDDDLSIVSDDEDGTVHSKNSTNSSNVSEKSDYSNNSSSTDKSNIKNKPKTYEEIQKEKQVLLFKLERLQKQGYPSSKKYSMASPWEDMNFEFERLKKQRDVEKSIKMSRKILLALVSGVEYLNDRFDPLDVKLNGWSENIMENINDYDEVFEELHDKYNTSVNMAPELKLLAMVAGSGFMFHLTNSLFKTASPDLNDILRQNPDIMKNITEIAAKNMQNNISAQMGPNDPINNIMMNGINNVQQNRNQPPPPIQPPVNRQPMNFPMRPSVSPLKSISKQDSSNNESELDNLLNELNGMNSSNKKSKRGGIQLNI